MYTGLTIGITLAVLGVVVMSSLIIFHCVYISVNIMSPSVDNSLINLNPMCKYTPSFSLALSFCTVHDIPLCSIQYHSMFLL